MASGRERWEGRTGSSHESELRRHSLFPSHLISTWAEILRRFSQFAACGFLLACWGNGSD